MQQRSIEAADSVILWQASGPFLFYFYFALLFFVVCVWHIWNSKYVSSSVSPEINESFPSYCKIDFLD